MTFSGASEARQLRAGSIKPNQLPKSFWKRKVHPADAELPANHEKTIVDAISDGHYEEELQEEIDSAKFTTPSQIRTSFVRAVPI